MPLFFMSIVRASRTPSLDMRRACPRWRASPFYIFLPGWYPQHRLQPDLFRRLTLRAFPELSSAAFSHPYRKGRMHTGAMPLADLRFPWDKRRRARRNRESTGKVGNCAEGIRHVGAWDVWRESVRRASKPKGPPSHAGTATFLRSRFAWRRGSYRFYSRRHRHNGTLARPI